MDNLSDPSTLVAIVTGILLSVSETLPFIKGLSSNGIIHMLIRSGKAFLGNHSELEPLLPNQIDFEQITSTMFKTTQDTLNIIAAKKELMSPEKYQMDYIIHYIKSNFPKRSLEIKYLIENNKILLEKNGYTTNFDSVLNINTIEW